MTYRERKRKGRNTSDQILQGRLIPTGSRNLFTANEREKEKSIAVGSARRVEPFLPRRALDLRRGGLVGPPGGRKESEDGRKTQTPTWRFSFSQVTTLRSSSRGERTPSAPPSRHLARSHNAARNVKTGARIPPFFLN